MDKKTKKRVEVLRTRVERLQRQIAAAKEQSDDPREPSRLEMQMEAERTRLLRLLDR
ncbi:MAG: hypothetical protein WD069_12760 [Planctomycetales bacterium]